MDKEKIDELMRAAFGVANEAELDKAIRHCISLETKKPQHAAGSRQRYGTLFLP